MGRWPHTGWRPLSTSCAVEFARGEAVGVQPQRRVLLDVAARGVGWEQRRVTREVRQRHLRTHGRDTGAEGVAKGARVLVRTGGYSDQLRTGLVTSYVYGVGNIYVTWDDTGETKTCPR